MIHLHRSGGTKIRTKIAKFVLPTAVAIVITYFLLKEIDIQEIPKTLSRLSVKALFSGFGCYCLLVWCKTLRFRELLGLESCRVHHLVPILALHTFWGNFLPMRTGDVSYVYLMQRRQNVDATQGIASLLVASLIDLLLLIGLMVGTASLLQDRLQRISWTLLYLMPLLAGIGLLTLLVIACIAPKFCMALAERCATPLLRINKTPLTWIVNKGMEVIREVTQLVRANTATKSHIRPFLLVWAYSFICLAIRFGFQCYLVAEMGVDIPLIEVLFALVFTNVFNLLPIQTVGNFGTTEFPFVWLLHLFGTSKATGTVVGFSLHLIILLYCLPLGAFGFLFGRPQPQPQHSQGEIT